MWHCGREVCVCEGGANRAEKNALGRRKTDEARVEIVPIEQRVSWCNEWLLLVKASVRW